MGLQRVRHDGASTVQPQLLKPTCSLIGEATTMRSPGTAMKSSPRSSQLENSACSSEDPAQTNNPICRTEKETEMYRTDFWTLWEKAMVGWSERIALKHVYYQVWNRSPAQVGCMRQVLRAGALGRSRGMGWGGRRERGSGWGTHVNPWLIHVNVWKKSLQYCKVISLQLIKINEKKFLIIFFLKSTYFTRLLWELGEDIYIYYLEQVWHIVNTI